jgi:hypothetical protein
LFIEKNDVFLSEIEEYIYGDVYKPLVKLRKKNTSFYKESKKKGRRKNKNSNAEQNRSRRKIKDSSEFISFPV